MRPGLFRVSDFPNIMGWGAVQHGRGALRASMPAIGAPCSCRPRGACKKQREITPSRDGTNRFEQGTPSVHAQAIMAKYYACPTRQSSKRQHQRLICHTFVGHQPDRRHVSGFFEVTQGHGRAYSKRHEPRQPSGRSDT